MAEPRLTAEILVVDDDAAIRELLRYLLGDEGYRVTLAADAAAARRLIQRQTFDVVLCDMTLPGESGLSLAAHLGSEHPDIAVVMVTALDSGDVAETAVGFGAFAYIVKPFRRSELLAAISSALKQRDLVNAAQRERNRLERRLIAQAGDLREVLDRQRSAAAASTSPYP
jgi:DNA-binding NtrC family response regulator